jgi:flagellar motor switch protein FliN
MADDGPLSQADIDALTAGLLGDAGGEPLDTSSLRPEVEVILEKGASVLTTLLNRASTLTLQDINDGELNLLSKGLDSDGLIVRLPIDQGFRGELCLFIHKEAAARLCDLMMGGDGTAAYKDEDADALNEFGNQFMGSVCTALGGRHGLSVSAGQAQTSTFDPNEPPFGLEGSALIDAGLAIEGFPEAIFRILLSPPLVSSLTRGSNDSDSGSSDDSSGMVQSGYEPAPARQSIESQPNVQMLLDINLNVTIELGRTRLSIRKILELGPGSIIELDRLAGEPVDLLVNDKVVAKGEVVVVDEYFGIRILTLVSPEERIRQLK